MANPATKQIETLENHLSQVRHAIKMTDMEIEDRVIDGFHNEVEELKKELLALKAAEETYELKIKGFMNELMVLN